MRVLITGTTGSIGRRLVKQLLGRGDELLGLSRDPARAATRVGLPESRLIGGDPTIPGDWQRAVAGSDAVVHLACSGLEQDTESKEDLEALRERRLDGIFQVVLGITQAEKRPRTLLVVSSMLAGNGDPKITTFGALHRSFEEEAAKACELGVRVVMLRLGLMLDEGGRGFEVIAGAGPVDSPVEFVHVEDVAGLLAWTLADETVSGVIVGCTSKPEKIDEMKRQVPGIRRRTPRGEVRALFECTTTPSVRCSYSCRFDTFGEVVQDLVGTSKPPAVVVDPHGEDDPVNAVVVLPCEGFLLEGMALLPNADRAVARLRDAGLSVLLATSCGGKIPLQLARLLGATDPIIAADGSALLDPGLGEAIRTESLGADRVSAIATAVRTADPRVTIIVERGVNVGWETEGALPAAVRGLTSIDEVVETQALFARPATRLLFHAPARRLERAIEVIRSSWWRERLVAIVEYAPDVVAITAPTADRGVALQRAESVMGVKRGTSIVVGATDRDAGLIEFAGIPFALPSLSPTIARGARSMLSSNDPLEVADALVRAHLARTIRAARRVR